MGAHDAGSWDALASRFDDEVCHVLSEDRRRVVARRLATEARRLRGRRAGQELLGVDFGCGTGRALPILARHVAELVATDLSEACLDVARSVARRPRATTFVQADLGRPRLRLPIPKPGADLALCINVAIMPNDRLRSRLLGNVAGHMRAGGRLLLVVPAHESQLLVRRRWKEWTGSRWRTGRLARQERADEGLYDIGGALTKLWTCEELESLGAQLGCRTVSIERVEYGWSTEFENPPRRFRAPYPFDWLAVLERRPPR
jgi:SAM-dependent methyltransferase